MQRCVCLSSALHHATATTMHELLLFAQVPASRHAQLLKIIAGIAGMQPQRVIERHLIFKPQRAPGTAPAQVGGSQGIQTQQAQALQGQMQGELFHIQLVGDVEPTLFPTGEAASGHDGKPLASATEDTEMKDANGAEASAANDLPSTTSVNPGSHQDVFENQSWSLRFSDLPEVAGRRPVTSRMISWVDFVDGNVVDFMDAVGYKYDTVSSVMSREIAHGQAAMPRSISSKATESSRTTSFSFYTASCVFQPVTNLRLRLLRQGHPTKSSKAHASICRPSNLYSLLIREGLICYRHLFECRMGRSPKV